MDKPENKINSVTPLKQRRPQVGIQLDARTFDLLSAEAAAEDKELAYVARRHISRSLFGDPSAHQLAEIKVLLTNLVSAQESMRTIDLREARDAIERRLVDLNRLSTITAEQITSYSKMTLSGLRKLKEAFTELHKIILTIRR